MDKEDHCWLWGILSGIGIAAAGTALVVCTGGVALVVAGVGLGAAISGEVNVVQQACNDKEEFDGKSFVTNVAIGGATGVVTAGAGGAASGLASKFALEGGKKLATQVGLSAAGGVFSSAGGSITQQVVLQDKKIKECFNKDLGVAALTGIVSGGVGYNLPFQH